ncbi:MAG TPA: hypothetical protein VIW24_19870 [Aldersonia sp.]
MRLRNHAARALAVLSVATAGFLATGAPASAATTEFGQTQTLANGALVCGGNLRAWATTDPGWRNNAILNVQALPLNGFGSSASFAPVCDVGVNVHWRNLNTGQQGDWPFVLVAGMYGSILYSEFKDVGIGRIVVDITTSMPHIPGHGEFNNP